MTDPTAGWIEMVAPLIALLRPTLEPLNIGLAVARLELRVMYHDFQGPTRAVALCGDTIVLDNGLRPQAAASSFAHEIAHIMLQRDIFHVPRAHDELFADWFGRELCLPRAWLGGAVNARLTARRYRVSQTTVAVQLASIGRAPVLQRLGNTVLCATCGPLEHSIDCPCKHWRRLPASARTMLPDVRQHPAWLQRPVSRDVQPALEFSRPWPLGCTQ
jgi:hypothetical protein